MVYVNKVYALFLITSLIAISHVYAYPYSSNDIQVDQALLWLRSRQGSNGAIGSLAVSSWAVMAITASEEDPNDWTNGGVSIVQYLKNNAATLSSSNDYSRFILSMVAAGEDPTDINNIDLVSTLESFYDGSQFEDPALLNDDYWAVMALISAGISEDDNKIQNTVTFIKTNQNPNDHGWSWGVGSDSDVDSTAAAIMALIAADEPETSIHITNALSYIKSKQTDSGGFDSWGFGTSAETDAWAIQAIIAAGQDPTGTVWIRNGNTPLDDLLSFQNPDGSFNDYNPAPSAWTTSYAIPAMLGKPYPTTKGARVDIRLEGQSATLWNGTVFVTSSEIIESTPNPGTIHYYSKPTIIGALDTASRIAGFDYTVDYTYGLAYVTEINGEASSGMNGWLFRVNDYTTGAYSADGFILNEATTPSPPHYSILWYYGGWEDKVLRISTDRTNINPGEAFTASVTYLDPTDESGAWLPLKDVTVYADSNYLTDSSGQVTITLSNSGTYDIYAEKTSFIRSEVIQVTVGSSSDDDSNLEVEIIPSLSLEVTPSYIDFGTLGPNMTSQSIQLQLNNKGSLDAKVTVTVTDVDSKVFQDCLQIYNSQTKNWIKWQDYRASISGHNGNQPGSITDNVRLKVPMNYPVVPGVNQGRITFWLEPQ